MLVIPSPNTWWGTQGSSNVQCLTVVVVVNEENILLCTDYSVGLLKEICWALLKAPSSYLKINNYLWKNQKINEYRWNKSIECLFFYF